MKEYRKYQGLYDPAYEHDACGVGIVANLNGQKTYDIIRNAIRVLINLEHRMRSSGASVNTRVSLCRRRARTGSG